jgi:hypothetical protein
MPGEPIGLQSAVELVIERRPSIDDPRDRSPAISCRAEFVNMRYGGSTLKSAPDERAELARPERIRAAARNWIKGHLRTGKLRICQEIIESTFDRVNYGFTTEFPYHIL